jgi:hypothetical protein
MASKAERDRRLQEFKDEYDISDEHWSEIQEAFAGTNLRNSLQEIQKERDEALGKAKKWDEYQASNGVQSRLKNLDVDWDGLSPLERRSVVGDLKDIEDEEQLRAYIEENQLPLSQQGSGTEETPAAENVVSFNKKPPQGGRTPAGSLDASTVASWPADKIARFANEYPGEYEQVMKGETVSGVAFT